MSKALALLSLTVLSSVYAAEVPQPSWTNHNRIAGSQQMMTNFRPWAEAVGSTIGDKRDKDDLAVYEVVRTENTDLKLTTNVVDRLATTNGVNAAMTNRYTKSETDAKLAGKLDSRAAERGSISWNVDQDDTANLNVSAISANFDGEIFVAGDSVFNGRVNCTYGWEGFESNGEILPVYLDSLEWCTTGNRSLADYGITDGATKTEVVPLWVAGHVYNAGDTVLYNGAYYRAMFDNTSSSPDKTFSYWEPITFENVDVYGGLSVHTGDLSVDNGDLELSGGGITVNSGFEIKRGINKVVYGISVNGGAAQHGDVSIDIPAPGNYAAVSNAAMRAVQPWQISHTNAMFSAEVLAVQIDTNTVAQIGELKQFFDDLPTGAIGTSLGGIILALLGAAAYLKKKTALLESDGKASDTFATDLLGKPAAKEAIDAEIVEKGTAPDAHLEAPTDEHLKLILADNSVAYDSAKALPYKLTSVIGDRVIATMTLTAASTDITLPTIAANDTTVKDFILDVTNAYAVEGVATDAGINIPRTDFKLVTRDGESLTAVTTVKAGKSAFICFTQKSPVVVDGTTYPCWCVIQLPFGDPS